MFWIHTPEPGRLGITPRPQGGKWLADEIARWRQARVTTVLSLLEPHEVRELGLEREAEICAQHRIDFLSFPILDRGVPDSLGKTHEMVALCRDRLMEGQALLVHCDGGIGRSAIIAACILGALGVEPHTAFERIEAARGQKVPDTADQRKWAEAFTLR
jgi:protein-tyrosine phosphatase